MTAAIGHDIVAECEQAVSRYGFAYDGDALFETETQQISLHTCFGPPQSGKSVNQDAALAVKCNNSTNIEWVCALADGVGSSLLSEVGSRVATWVAIEAFLKCSETRSPRKKSESAVEQARCKIAALSERLQLDDVDLNHKPSYLPAPAYRHILKKKTCFQTTLCLVWSDGHSIFIASVGDSGALHTAARNSCETLFFPDVSDPRVNAICPTLDEVQLDHWVKVKPSRTSLAVFTDGVAKSLVEQRGAAFPKDFNLHEFCSRKDARERLTELTETTSEEEADNMSLLIVCPR